MNRRQDPATMTDDALVNELRQWRGKLRTTNEEIFALRVQARLIENTIDVITGEIRDRLEARDEKAYF